VEEPGGVQPSQATVDNSSAGAVAPPGHGMGSIRFAAWTKGFEREHQPGAWSPVVAGRPLVENMPSRSCQLMRWPTEAQSRGWHPPRWRRAQRITLHAQSDADTTPIARFRGVRSSSLRALGPALWQPSRETDSRPPDVRVGTATVGFALDISPFKRRRESTMRRAACQRVGSVFLRGRFAGRLTGGSRHRALLSTQWVVAGHPCGEARYELVSIDYSRCSDQGWLARLGDPFADGGSRRKVAAQSNPRAHRAVAWWSSIPSRSSTDRYDRSTQRAHGRSLRRQTRRLSPPGLAWSA
jgi:hypothetical protein